MWKDEIVEEVRRTREEFAAQYNYDISAICNAIRERQQQSEHKIVNRSVKTDSISSSENESEERKVA